MLKSIKAIIVDEEATFINILKKMLSGRAEIHILGQAQSIKEAHQLVQLYQPDLIFIDVKIEGNKGYHFLKKIKYLPCKIIIITAHKQFAFEAFSYNAIDYLLKPLGNNQLLAAIEKVKEHLMKNQLLFNFNQLLENRNTTDKKKIVLKEMDTHHVIDVDQVLWCGAEGSYTRFFLENNQFVIVSKHLKSYETLLMPYRFFRIHRSYLVNVNKIKRFEKSDGGIVYLEGGHQLPVSFRKKDHLSHVLSRM